MNSAVFDDWKMWVAIFLVLEVSGCYSNQIQKEFVLIEPCCLKSAERNCEIVPIGKLKYCRLIFEKSADYRTEKLIVDGYQKCKIATNIESDLLKNRNLELLWFDGVCVRATIPGTQSNLLRFDYVFFCKFNRAVAKEVCFSCDSLFLLFRGVFLYLIFFVQIKFIREVGFDGFFVCKPTAKASVRCTY